MIFARIFLSIIFLCITSSCSAQEQKPNIIFIFADDWGWGDLGVHGSEIYQTPNIDQLAAQGTDFYNFSVSSPVCSPSRTAVMTGHFPERHNVGEHFATIKHHERANMGDWLDPNAPSLPRILNQAGYATGHFGKWHLTNVQIKDAPLPPQYGYDEFGAFNLPGDNMPPAETADRVIDFISRHKDQPFFVNMWIHETHTPHYPEPKIMKEFGHLSEQQMVYASILAAGDRDVGKVMDALEELGLTENTLVIFSSDNGPESPTDQKYMDDDSTGPGFGRYYSIGETGGLKGQKRSLYAGGVRVPFIVRWPGVTTAGAKDHGAVITAVDMLPTLADIAGASLPEGYKPDGQNMRKALENKEFKRSKSIYWVWPPGVTAQTAEDPKWPQFGIQSGKWKLLVNDSLNKVELYDAEADWYEQTDLSDEYPEVVEQMRSELESLRSQFPVAPDESTLSSLRRK